MILRLFLLLTLVPVLDLAFLVHLGSLIGPWWTIGLVLVTGFAGAWLARREGFAVLRKLQDSLQRGLPPASTLVEGAMVLAGSVLLVTPGVFTDVVGFALIVPWTRRVLAPLALRALLRRFRVDAREARRDADGGDGGDEVWTGPARGTSDSHRLPFDHPVR